MYVCVCEYTHTHIHTQRSISLISHFTTLLYSFYWHDSSLSKNISLFNHDSIMDIKAVNDILLVKIKQCVC